MTREPLASLRVIELGSGVSAAYATKLLADLGADVIKVEPPGGDPLRSYGTFPDDPRDPTVGCLFRYLNTNKRSIVLDLTHPEAAATFLRLASGADLIIENLGPDGLERLGLSFERLREANPAIALIRISDFGQDGPLSRIPATDCTVQAAGAWISKHFSAGREPVQVGGSISDYGCAAHAAAAALTAWRTARQSGRAVIVDVSKQECLLSTLPQPALYYETLQQLGMGLPEDRVFPVPGVVPCKDGMVGINVLTAQHHADFCNLVGRPEYIPRQLELNAGGATLEQFYRDIEPWLMERTAEEIVEMCQAFRIPAIPVGNGRNLPEMAQFKARSFYVKDIEGRFVQPGFPYRLEKTPPTLRRPAPAPGEHNPALDADPWQAPKQRPRVGAPSQDPGTPPLPFKGLRVLDLGTFWAGPYVACYLGAQGADVIKIESIQRPDGFRYSAAYPQLGKTWYEQGGPWQGTNLNKRDLTLNLDSPEGKRIFERLVPTADTLIENFAPRVIENFGFGPSRLRELNPRLIIMRLPGFGLEGPWRDYVGWGMSFEQGSGMAWLTGKPDELPLNPGGFSDPLVAMHALVALEAALEHRERTGEAQIIEIAQLEVGACITAEQVIAYSVSGRLQMRTGNRSERMAPQGVYKCADGGWVALSVRNDAEWERMAQALGSPAWAADPRFSTFPGRKQHHDELDRRISEWALTLPSKEAVNRLREGGIPAAKILTAPEMYDDPHLKAREFYQYLPHALLGRKRYPRFPMRQSPGLRGAHRFGAPTLGQHNREILMGELGLSEAEITELERKEVIGTVPKGLR